MWINRAQWGSVGGHCGSMIVIGNHWGSGGIIGAQCAGFHNCHKIAVITCVCQYFSVREQIPKSIYQVSLLLSSDFPNNFLKLVLI